MLRDLRASFLLPFHTSLKSSNAGTTCPRDGFTSAWFLSSIKRMSNRQFTLMYKDSASIEAASKSYDPRLWFPFNVISGKAPLMTISECSGMWQMKNGASHFIDLFLSHCVYEKLITTESREVILSATRHCTSGTSPETEVKS